MMRSLMFPAFLASLVAAQAVPPPEKPKPGESTVQVRGCLHGQTLILTEDPGFTVPGGKLDLKGDRRIMRGLKEHNGHIEEIVGVLKMPSGSTAVPIIDVRAFSLVGPKCR